MTDTCFDVYKNLNIEFRDNKIKISPCCLSQTVSVYSLDFYNDNYLNNIRKSWNNNIPHSSCGNCIIAEKNNLVSRRIGSNQWYIDNNIANTDVDLIRLDFWTGDLCNLRCAICGPRNSSAWKQELNFPVEQKKVNVNKIWKELNLKNLKFIHFNGGEPLLSKEHVDFLNAIPDKSKVHLNYNTNGTIIPNQNLFDLWKEFKIVQLDFSIDDIGARFYYQRFPATWEQIVENLNFFRSNCSVNTMFAVNTSLGILNNHNYQNLLSWLQTNFATNKVTDPVEFRTQFTHGILGLDNYRLRKKEIVNYLDSLDARRNTDWRSTFPELTQIL